jgi:hypothetical protein
MFQTPVAYTSQEASSSTEVLTKDNRTPFTSLENTCENANADKHAFCNFLPALFLNQQFLDGLSPTLLPSLPILTRLSLCSPPLLLYLFKFG